MTRDRLALGIALVLTVLYAGAMLAALTGRAAEWSARMSPAALHVVGGAVVAAIALNLARGERAEP